MLESIRATTALMLLLVLAACATPSIPFDRSSAKVTAITVLGPAMANKPTVGQAATIGQSFGLIGALVDAGIAANREGKLNTVLATENYMPKESLKRALQVALEAKGYKISFDDPARPNRAYLKEYPAAAAGADAYLDVVVTDYGYLLAGLRADFRPFAWLQCKLIRASDHAVLMQSTIQYNPMAASKNVITVAPNPNFAFNTMDDMGADPLKAVAGMDDSFNQIATTIATLLQ